MKVATFNILGSIWADPQYYPPQVKFLLNSNLRLSSVINTLKDLGDTCDIIGLQEVTYSTVVDNQSRPGAYEKIHRLFGEQFYVSFVPHGWHHWYTDRSIHQYNGNVLLLKKDTFTSPTIIDLPLGKLENHAIIAQTTHLSSSKTIRITNVHLDDQDSKGRLLELFSALYQSSCDIDIVLGDFNHYVNYSLNGYQPSVLGNRSTQPYSYGLIDNVLYRGNICLQNWEIQDTEFRGKSPVDRLIYNLYRCGSDHYPVVVTFLLDISGRSA